jgi:hypothetical protein
MTTNRAVDDDLTLTLRRLFAEVGDQASPAPGQALPGVRPIRFGFARIGIARFVAMLLSVSTLFIGVRVTETLFAPNEQPTLRLVDIGLLTQMARPVAPTLAFLQEASEQAKPLAVVNVARTFGFPKTLLVIDMRADFVQVELPETLSPVFEGGKLPATKHAWVRANDVRLFQTGDAIEINTAKRTLTASISGKRFTTSIAVSIGGFVESPKGRFQIFEQRLAKNPDGVFGPGELRLTARSPMLETYMGDDPYFIAIQGTNTPSLIGQAVTHGNFRLSNTAWLKLAKLPIGTLVIIR